MNKLSSAFRQGFKQEVNNSSLVKEGFIEALRQGVKGLKHNFTPFSGFSSISDEAFSGLRSQAKDVGDQVTSKLDQQDVGVISGRIKTPSSIKDKGINPEDVDGFDDLVNEGVDDVVGMRTVANDPEEVRQIKKSLEESGIDIEKANVKTREGYHGVNIKGRHSETGVPVEMQAVPSRTSAAASTAQHSLAYKPQLEAPNATAVDRFIGEEVLPYAVNNNAARQLDPALDPSWIDENQQALEAIF